MLIGSPWSKLGAVVDCSKGATSRAPDWKNMDREKMPRPVAAFCLQHQRQNVLKLEYEIGGFKVCVSLLSVGEQQMDPPEPVESTSPSPRWWGWRRGADPAPLCVHVCKAVLFYIF